MSSAPHPAEIVNPGGQPDYSYLEGPQAPIGASFADAYTHADDGIDLRIGADPEDGMVKGADGQLYSAHAVNKQPREGDRYDEPTGNFRSEQSLRAPEAASTIQATPGTVALHGVGVGRPSRVYRSGSLNGSPRPHAYASHRAEN